MNALFLKRYPLVALFLLIQLSVMIAGVDRKAWPFINFTMYSRLDSFKNWQLFVISAEDRDGNAVPWPAIKKSFAPYSKPVDLNFFFNTYPPSATCEFLKSKLNGLDGIGKLVVSMNPVDLDTQIPFVEITRERGCVQLH